MVRAVKSNDPKQLNRNSLRVTNEVVRAVDGE